MIIEVSKPTGADRLPALHPRLSGEMLRCRGLDTLVSHRPRSPDPTSALQLSSWPFPLSSVLRSPGEPRQGIVRVGEADVDRPRARKAAAMVLEAFMGELVGL
mmetsp:Transcript_70302/g.126719  ORF Transcript_70302/g.126719 Transcript_70302/m.126719 type:complete len:103 (+) Transcript_70302:1024-1332(+)